jgi:GNAT superfamily N-acetyltransferase
MIEVRPVNTAAERMEFIRLVWRLHESAPGWVPPLIAEQKRALDPKKGEFFRQAGTGALWMAWREGEPVGRIAAFRNEVHLATHRDEAGFFGFFESIDDIEVAGALLRKAEAWLRQRGLKVARGPANFNIQEEAGVSFDAHDLQPMVGMAWTPDYYLTLLAANGYHVCKDLWVYRVDWKSDPKHKIARWEAIERRALRRSGVKIRPVNFSKLKEESEFLAKVFGESWQGNWGHVPIRAEEFLEFYQRYRLFLVPETILLAEIDGEPVGVWVALPDLNEGIKQIDGRLWPFGWWRLLRMRSSIPRYRAMLLGVRPAYQHLGIPFAMVMRFRREFKRLGGELLECSWLLEENKDVLGVVRRMGGYRVQTLRLYEKELTS